MTSGKSDEKMNRLQRRDRKEEEENNSSMENKTGQNH